MIVHMDAAQATSSRSSGVDAVRVLGVAAVVLGHVWQHGLARDLTYSWHVPVFFFLSGYLWRSGRTIGDEWRNRFRTLGIPYLAWFVPLLAVYIAAGALTGNLSMTKVAGFVYGGHDTGRPFITFWFLSVLLATTLLYRLVSRLPLWAQWLIAAVGVALGALFGRVLSRTPLSMGIAAICLVFVVAGASARQIEPRLVLRVPLGLVLVAGPLVLAVCDIVQPVDLKGGRLGTPVLGVLGAIAISWGLLLLANAAFERLPERVGRTVSMLALPAIGVVLAHPIVLWILQTPTNGRLLDAVLAVVIPWVVVLLVMRTPVAPILTGVRRPATV